MRNLKTSDLFALSRIVKKMEIKDDLKKLVKDVTGATQEEKKKAEQEMEIDLVMLFAENILKAEQEIYKFLGELNDKKPKEISDQPPTQTFNMIKELFGQEDFKNFLSMVSK